MPAIDEIKFLFRDRKDSFCYKPDKSLGPDNSKYVRAFHQSFNDYSPTPLIKMTNLSYELGLDSILVKDESYRFGQESCSVLGASYAIASIIAEKLNTDVRELCLSKLRSDDILDKLGPMTFVTASRGNFGKAVAWFAHTIRQHSRVFFPKGTDEDSISTITYPDADVEITDDDFRNTFQYALNYAALNNCISVMDSSVAGNEMIPALLMEGYLTIADEIIEQLKYDKPSHVFVQAGSGCMAASVCAFFTSIYGNDRPVISVVEPSKAGGIYCSVEASDNGVHEAKGNQHSIMAELCCQKPCSLAFEILNGYADCFICVPEWVAAKGMRILGNPSGNDNRVLSGPSGAVTAGFLAEVMTNPSLNYYKEELKLDDTSKVLLISTEGITGCRYYRSIVWDGLFPSI